MISLLALKFSKREPKITKLNQCKSFIILFEGKTEDEILISNKYAQLANEFEIDAKILFLRISPDIENKYSENSIAISNTDISILGTIQNKRIKELFHLSFDYAINLNLPKSSLERFLFSRLNAKCRVGNYNNSTIEIYDIILKHKNTLETNLVIIFEKKIRQLKLVS